jgi:LmbE family N-acetylglucosaminyl deacetylase
MLSLQLHLPGDRPARVLCLGAHADDIEIGCGGTLLTLLGSGHDVSVHWVVFSAMGEREREARASADSYLEGAARARVETHSFRDGYFPYEGGAIKDAFEALKSEVEPDVVFTHHRNDLHQDHRLVAELSRNTFRDHLLLEYEIPKYDADLTSPNLYVPLAIGIRERKLDLLMTAFATQRSKRWFTRQTFEGLMALRGVESASPTGYAEGFHAHKIVALG